MLKVCKYILEAETILSFINGSCRESLDEREREVETQWEREKDKEREVERKRER